MNFVGIYVWVFGGYFIQIDKELSRVWVSANRCLTLWNTYGVYIYDIIGFMKLDWVEFNNNGVCVIRKKNNGACIVLLGIA